MYESIYLKTPTFVIAHNTHQKILKMQSKKSSMLFGTGKNINFKKIIYLYSKF